MKGLYRCTDYQCSFLVCSSKACMLSATDCSVLWSHYLLLVCQLFFTSNFLCIHPKRIVTCKGYMFSVLLAQSLWFFQDKIREYFLLGVVSSFERDIHNDLCRVWDGRQGIFGELYLVPNSFVFSLGRIK